MINERELIAQLEAAGPQALAEMLVRPSPEEERALRTHLGDARFERMREKVLQSSLTRAGRSFQGNVVVLHGIMGGELTFYESDAQPEPIWLKVFRILSGQFSRLTVNDQGSSVSRIQATGILKRYYGEQLLALMQRWNTRAFWFDWRLDINTAADQLALRIQEWFGDDEPVHLVVHSMGGLVARTFIKRHPKRWRSMWDTSSNGRSGGRLVMLGTPNHGSFAIPQLVMGLNDVIKKLALLDVRHNLQDLLNITTTFVGTYQMLPSPYAMPGMEKLYEAGSYAPMNVPPNRLAMAREFHDGLRMIVDPDRMLYVAGYNQPTYTGIRDWNKLGSLDGYEVTRRGDGTVPHKLGLLQTLDGRPVPTFYVEGEHGQLPGNESVMAAVDDLLQNGTTNLLSQTIPPEVRGEGNEEAKQIARAELLVKRETEQAQLRQLAVPLQARVKARGDGAEEPPLITEDERKLEDLLIRGFVGTPEAARGSSVSGTPLSAATGGSARPVPKIKIRLLDVGIQEVGNSTTDQDLPVDAISVGHYIGVKPVAAEKALDQAISLPLSDRTNGQKPATEVDLLLTQFTERGIICGELGQPFFLADPRRPDRLIGIAGMGHVGRFGTAELAVLARELCWSLGRLGKRHLATVLIGSGNGNLSVRDAASAWLEGIKRAITSSEDDLKHHLETITFVDVQARKLLKLRKVMEAAVDIVRSELEVELLPLTAKETEQLVAKAAQERENELRAERDDGEDERSQGKLTSDVPTRLTVELDDDSYRFGAITETASVPERKIPLDPDLVNDANSELAAQRDPGKQAELGEFLERLLIPSDLQPLLSSNAPLVLTCDSTVARVHWEMVAQPDPLVPTSISGNRNRNFLGICRGFTRQLRTTFAPPPEPPPPPNRVLRVLIVGDPAADDPLPGAQEEAMLVRDLFQRFREQERGKKVGDVEIIALLGPAQATRTRVMQELILRSYDILHYAGHCKYQKDRPSASGWIFTGGKRLSANELSRIDRIPKFVFSNACESGITPDRSEERSAELAPSFAESFFARGVQNLVCTAWPVNDLAARDFAKRLYVGLLGLDGKEVEPMHVAMREARNEIFSKDYGLRTWGAYQHYGNPYFRLFR